MRRSLMIKTLARDSRYSSRIGYVAFFVALVAVQALPPIG